MPVQSESALEEEGTMIENITFADVPADAPELQASRIVGKLLTGDVTRAKAEEQLEGLGYGFCPHCSRPTDPDR
jgi:hypothetical protein